MTESATGTDAAVGGAALRPGQKIGEYVLEEPLGAGGFGEVWRARHGVWKDRVVAVKVPRDREVVRALAREGTIARALEGVPGVVPVIGLDPDADPPYLAMDYVDGESLRARIRREARIAPRDALAIGASILRTLGAAHERGIVHRDLKPENVLLPKDGGAGAAKLVDFGIGKVLEEEVAKLALSGSLATADGRDLKGTIAYMAPEQRSPDPSRPVDARADLYAFGLILFEMLTGHLPEGGEEPSDLVAGLDPRVDDVFKRCYCRLEARAGTVAELLPALTSIADADGGIPSPKERTKILDGYRAAKREKLLRRARFELRAAGLMAFLTAFCVFVSVVTKLSVEGSGKVVVGGVVAAALLVFFLVRRAKTIGDAEELAEPTVLGAQAQAGSRAKSAILVALLGTAIALFALAGLLFRARGFVLGVAAIVVACTLLAYGIAKGVRGSSVSGDEEC